MSIFDRTNLYEARSASEQDGGDTVYFGDSSPIDPKTTQSTGGYTIELGLEVDGVSAGISKEYDQTYSTIDGRNYLDDNNVVYEHDGGYRSIAENHHNESREYAEAAAWIFPSGTREEFSMGWMTETAAR